MTEERRRCLRVAPDPAEPVEVQIMGPGFLEVVNALNVCEQGVGIHLPHGIDPDYTDELVEIILTLPRCRPAHLRGVIRHLEGYPDACYLGVHFVRPSPRLQALLKRYVYANRHRPHAPPLAQAATKAP